MILGWKIKQKVEGGGEEKNFEIFKQKKISKKFVKNQKKLKIVKFYLKNPNFI